MRATTRSKSGFRLPPGTPPGTLRIRPDAPAPKVSLMSYDPEGLEETAITDTNALTGIRAKHAVTWIDVTGLGDEATLLSLGERFGLHRLALEDVVNVTQRPKVEEYEGHYYIVLRMPRGHDTVETEQLSIFLGADFVLTFQEEPGDCLEPIRKRIREGRARIRGAGPSYLAYAILDAVIDSYFPILDHYGERLLALEERLLAERIRVPISNIHDLKRDLMHLRGSIRPLREELALLVRADHPLLTPATQMFLRDAYDHVIQLMDHLETDRELVSNLIELHRSNEANRLNEVMKVLTIIATLFIPMSFVAGVYGMNFNTERSPWNLPELDWYLGYPFALGIMLAVAVGMLIYFRRKGWLG
jgi:magnesium transporter